MQKLTFLPTLFFTCLLTAFSSEVNFSEKADQYTLKLKDIGEISASSTAVFSVDGKNFRIGTRDLPIQGPGISSSVTTPFGRAIQVDRHYGEKGEPYLFTLRIRQLIDLQAITLQGFFHNRSEKDINLTSLELLDATTGMGIPKIGNPADWLITPLMQHIDAETLAEMNSGFNEVGLFVNTSTQKSFLIGPVGPAEAHCRIEVHNKRFKAYAQMDRVLVSPGETRRSEEILLIAEDRETNIDIWTRWVAVTHRARNNKGPIYGWCSWYDRTTKIDEAHVMDVVDTIENNPNTFGRGIVQIDDGYQIMDGTWNANAKFPSGMARVARSIREAGMIPGVWFAPLMINPEHPWKKANPEAIQSNAKGISSFMNPNPFHPAGANWINPSHPESKKFLRQVIETARDNGYGYIKIDFNGIGNRYVDPKLTRLQAFRELYNLYRDAAGEDMYILSCLGQPTRGVVGFVDAARIGPDSHPAHFAHCLKSVLRFQIFNRVWWNNDADVSYLDVKLPSRRVGYTPEGIDMWRTWHNTVALTGGTAMISEPVNKPDIQAVWRNYEIMRPSSRENSRLLTLGNSDRNSIFGFSAGRTWGDFSVYNLYNSDKNKSADITLDFGDAGLPSGTRCAVYDFWKNKVVGYATDSFIGKNIPKNGSLLLRFTPLIGEFPLLVGSNLHLSMGATEIEEVYTTSKSIKIMLSSAGAQSGDLFFHSSKAIEAGSTENCLISSVQGLGDNLWQVSVKERIWDSPQSFVLNINKM
jgi:hypothetical protein